MVKINKVKQISFSTQILEKVDKRLEDLGIGFPEYIRFLVLNDMESNKERIYINEELEKALDRSINDIINGKVTKLSNPKEIKDHFNHL